MIRHERTGIEFPAATWTTFDRYDRYGAIARCLRASLGDGRHRVLDVGDAAGYLPYFTGDIDLVGVDLRVQPERLDGSIAIEADGSRLPFADGTFDAVVSSDVLEHVPTEIRPAFLAELSRVSRDLVIVAAPFDTEGVAGVEETVRRYALLVTGTAQEQLDEHRDCGLPDLAATRTALEAHGPAIVVGNGNLWDWLELMLVKHQLMARPALQPLHDGIDLLSNLSLAGRASEAPYYRHLVASRRGATPVAGEIVAPPISSDRAAGLISTLLTAAGPESTRQDVVPTIDGVSSTVQALVAEVAGLRNLVEGRLASIDADLVVVREQGQRLNSLVDRLTAPVRRVRRGRAESADD